MAGKKAIPTDPNALLVFIAGYVQDTDFEIRLLKQEISDLKREVQNLERAIGRK